MSKRIAIIAVGISCIVSVASAQSVTSGIFGFTKVVAPAGDFKMLGTAFDVGDDGVTSLDEMLGTNGFFASYSETAADKVYIWDRSTSTYLTAFLNDSLWGATNPDTSDPIAYKWCYMDSSASTYPLSCAANSAYDLVPGDSVYAKVNNDVDVTFSGDVPGDSSIDVVIYEGFNMIMNPYPVSVALKSIISTNDGAFASYSQVSADKIYLWDNASGSYKTYFLNDSLWGATNPDTGEPIAYKWCYMDSAVSTYPLPSTNLVSACTGFYYYKQNAGSITWAQDRPYDID